MSTSTRLAPAHSRRRIVVYLARIFRFGARLSVEVAPGRTLLATAVLGPVTFVDRVTLPATELGALAATADLAERVEDKVAAIACARFLGEVVFVSQVRPEAADTH